MTNEAFWRAAFLAALPAAIAHPAPPPEGTATEARRHWSPSRQAAIVADQAVAERERRLRGDFAP